MNLNNVRPALLNNFAGSDCFLQPMYFSLDDIPIKLAFAPVYVFITGLFGLVILYGIDWRAKEVPTEEI